jgi:hypothetical protein
MTQLEEELQQAKMTITQLKDTTLRQDMILQQYAEEVIVFCLRTVSKSEAGKEAVRMDKTVLNPLSETEIPSYPSDSCA